MNGVGLGRKGEKEEWGRIKKKKELVDFDIGWARDGEVKRWRKEKEGGRREEWVGGWRMHESKKEDRKSEGEQENINPYRNHDSPHILWRPSNLLTSISE